METLILCLISSVLGVSNLVLAVNLLYRIIRGK